MNLGAVWKVGSERENDRWTEVFAEVDNRRYSQVFEVLGREDDDFPLGYEEGEFVLCLTRKAAELDAGNHGTCGRRQVLDVSARAESRETWISVFGMFVMFEGVEWGNFMFGSPAGKVLGILGHALSRAETKGDVQRTLAG